MPQIDWTPDNLRFFWILYGVLSFFTVVGAVTSLRWAVRWELRLKARKRLSPWRAAPNPTASIPQLFPKTTKEPRHPRHNGETPMRSGPGPRDWKPNTPTE